jgi:hypothetical protein
MNLDEPISPRVGIDKDQSVLENSVAMDVEM